MNIIYFFLFQGFFCPHLEAHQGNTGVKQEEQEILALGELSLGTGMVWQPQETTGSIQKSIELESGTSGLVLQAFSCILVTKLCLF